MILQFLLNYFLSEYKEGAFKPLYELLEQNSFDIFKALKNAKVETFAPLISSFLNSAPSKETFNSSNVFETKNGLQPINSLAHKEIVYTLSQYFSS